MPQLQLTMLISREDDGYTSRCLELDIASQGKTVAEARSNLEEAIEGFLKAAPAKEISDRLSIERYVETFSAVFGTTDAVPLNAQTKTGSRDRLAAIVNGLIDGWCKRQALRPVGMILGVWPPQNGFTDEWQMVRDSLRHIRAAAKSSLTPDEATLLNEALAILDVSLRR